MFPSILQILFSYMYREKKYSEDMHCLQYSISGGIFHINVISILLHHFFLLLVFAEVVVLFLHTESLIPFVFLYLMSFVINKYRLVWTVHTKNRLKRLDLGWFFNWKILRSVLGFQFSIFIFDHYFNKFVLITIKVHFLLCDSAFSFFIFSNRLQIGNM